MEAEWRVMDVMNTAKLSQDGVVTTNPQFAPGHHTAEMDTNKVRKSVMMPTTPLSMDAVPTARLKLAGIAIIIWRIHHLFATLSTLLGIVETGNSKQIVENSVMMGTMEGLMVATNVRWKVTGLAQTWNTNYRFVHRVVETESMNLLWENNAMMAMIIPMMAAINAKLRMDGNALGLFINCQCVNRCAAMEDMNNRMAKNVMMGTTLMEMDVVTAKLTHITIAMWTTQDINRNVVWSIHVVMESLNPTRRRNVMMETKFQAMDAVHTAYKNQEQHVTIRKVRSQRVSYQDFASSQDIPFLTTSCLIICRTRWREQNTKE